MCLLDPFSSAEIPVPHERTFPGYEQLRMEDFIFVRKFALSARPSETADYILMIICGCYGYLAFWRPGDESWNRIEIQIQLGGPYWDVIYYGGHFYAIDSGSVQVFTIEGDKPPEGRIVTHFIRDVIHNLHARNTNDVVLSGTLYILKTSQSLFVISRTATWCSHEDHTFRVYEVDMSTCTWTEVKNLGSMAIFIGHNSTFAIDTSRLFGKIKPNHIYFTDDGWQCYQLDEEEGCGKDMGAYNMETETIESFYPGEVLLSKVCLPIWITPSF